MSRPHDKKVAVLERRREVTALCLRGYSQGEIAQRLGISPVTVSRDLQACRAEWRKAQVIDMAERQAEELAKIDYLERNAWEAWERSCQDAETLHVKQEADGSKNEASGKPVVTKTVSEKTTKKQAAIRAFWSAWVGASSSAAKFLGWMRPRNRNTLALPVNRSALSKSGAHQENLTSRR